jgi:hypothetical protein
MARIDEIVDGIYRISTTIDVGFGFQFNQFLIDDERPALIHTGMHAMYGDVRAAVGEVLDPARLAYLALLHFESDECGGMDRFLEGAPDSTLACSAASVQLNLSGWNYAGRVEGHEDAEVIDSAGTSSASSRRPTSTTGTRCSSRRRPRASSPRTCSSSRATSLRS